MSIDIFGAESSNNNGMERLYLNKNCKCGKRAGIRISESKDNKNKLYYYCKEVRCGSFIGWCQPATTSHNNFSNGSVESRLRLRERANNEELQLLKEEIEVLKTENMIMVEKMKGVKLALGYMRTALEMAMMITISVFV